MSLDGVAEAGTLDSKLREILSSSKTVNEKDSAAVNQTKATDSKKKQNTEATAATENKTMTMRQKLEAYREGNR